jgi:hypothetical protein
MNVLEVNEINAELRGGATKQVISTLMYFVLRKQQWKLSPLLFPGVSTCICVLVRFIHTLKRHMH